MRPPIPIRPLRGAFVVLWLTGLLSLGGCEILNAFDHKEAAPAGAATEDAVRVVNETDRTLYVFALPAASLQYVRLASIVTRDDADAGIVAQGDSIAVPLADLGEGPAEDDAAIFLVYAPTGAQTDGRATYELAAWIERSHDELQANGFRVVVRPHDLRPGDPHGAGAFVPR